MSVVETERLKKGKKRSVLGLCEKRASEERSLEGQRV